MIQFLIAKSKNLNQVQKKVHSILLWIIPFVWGLLVITSMRLLTKDSKNTREKLIHDSEYKDNMTNLTMGADQHDN
jgi:hypothetical protein